MLFLLNKGNQYPFVKNKQTSKQASDRRKPIFKKERKDKERNMIVLRSPPFDQTWTSTLYYSYSKQGNIEGTSLGKV